MKPVDDLSDVEKRRLLECWERLREGEATEGEVKEMHELIGSGRGADQWLAQAVLLEAELRFDGDSLNAREKVPTESATGFRSWSGLRWSHAAAAGVAAVLSWGVWSATQEKAGTVATLVKAQSCKWGNNALPTLEGSSLVPGTLELVEGMATLHFHSGAEVVLEAPVSLEIVSSMEARVRHGTIVAEVPPQAKGFTIQTAETTVVDFGTKFGVSASEDGKCLVQVIEGLVEVNRKGQAAVESLRSGERVDYGGMTQSKLNPDADRQQAEPGRWLPVTTMTNLGDGWQVVTTAFGEGQDSWIQSNPKHRVTGQETFLRVKHSTHDGTLERRIYLAFDVSKLSGAVADAELVLHLEPSDLGYGSLVPDATFEVFGLTNESEDHWSEDELSWLDAPAQSDAVEQRFRPDPARARSVGTFRVEQGRQSGAVSLRGEALTDFLREDSNGIVTLIVGRITDEMSRNGLVHAFASKENARNAPPMLRVRVVPD
jgi:hypothetical protein